MTIAKDIDDMLASLPKSERLIVLRLRELVQECLPKATEKCYYGEGIPFYRNNRLICFIWPSSVYWGPKRNADTQKNKGVSLGFNQGYLMTNDEGLLQFEKRKQVGVVSIHSLQSLDEIQIKSLLFEAGLIDDGFRKKKKSS